jgi:hypothetical protein
MRCRFPSGGIDWAAASRNRAIALLVGPVMHSRQSSRWLGSVPVMSAFGLAGSTLIGCTVLPQRGAETAIVPVLKQHSGVMDAAVAYAHGKAALAKADHEAGIAWFDEAIAIAPDSADGYNGKFVALARMGRVQDALDVARLALARGLRSQELMHNLVSVHGMKREVGADAEARAATPSIQPIEPSATHDAQASTSALQAPSTAPHLRWSGQGTQVLELLVVTPSVAQARAALPAPSSVPERPPERRHRVEVSNGAGVNGLAMRTAKSLSGSAFDPHRITNYHHFKVKQTQVRFASTVDLDTATRLAKTLSPHAVIVADSKLRAGVDLRIVLGRDVIAAGAFATAKAPRVAQVASSSHTNP